MAFFPLVLFYENVHVYMNKRYHDAILTAGKKPTMKAAFRVYVVCFFLFAFKVDLGQ